MRRGDDTRVLGFYTLGIADVAFEVVTTVSAERPPSYPLLFALTGRLDLHEQAERRGVATALVTAVLRRSSTLSAASV